ncbi:MAG: cell division protein FtsZ [Anaerolineaceae bacterium]|nr:cell division protein FtsZ [Anaerolineaceae bacterium]
MPAKPLQHTPLNARMPVIKVIGLGGGGSNAINRMIELDIQGVEFIAANTDRQALQSCLAPQKIQLGPRLTRGLGSGGNPNIGEAAAEESYRELNAALMGADMVFLTAGMGGGTGSGAISVAARVAKNLGAVTIAVVTTPFTFEVGRRQKNAQECLSKLRPNTDTLITVPNDRLLQIAPHDLPLELAFRMADDVLRQGIQGISELILQSGLINVDFAHIRQMMLKGGGSFLSIGYGEGENKAAKAIENALRHPLLESIPIENATGVIANFTGGNDLTFLEVAEALSALQNRTNCQAEIIPGVMSNDQMVNRAQAILVITGIGATSVDTTLRHSPLEHCSEPVAELAEVVPTPFHHTSVVSQVELAGAATDLDLPAFLRRRIR